MSRETRAINGEVKEGGQPLVASPVGPMVGPMVGAVAGSVGRMLDILLPPHCGACGTQVAGAGTLCPECWSKARFLNDPGCAVCGHPFEYDPGPGALCGGCHAHHPAYARARAAAVYDDVSRPLVLALKHGDRTELAPKLARWMLRAGAELIGDADLVVPVPLHWTRLFSRRFNQAALLAQALGRLSGLAVHPDLLVRLRATPSQGGLNAHGRKRNVRGVFAVRARARAHVQGRRILLVDDVLTTGATAEAAARALLDAGAGAVDVLTLTRVMRAA